MAARRMVRPALVILRSFGKGRIETMKSMVIRAEVVGRRGTSYAPLRLERSFPFQTARDLLCSVVEQQVDEYCLRKQDAQLLRILSAEAIEDGRSAGKVVSGGQDQDARVPAVPDAIRTA